MLTIYSTPWLEEKKSEFDRAVQNKEWEKLSEIEREVEEADFYDVATHLSSDMTEEEIIEYRNWNKKVNGDIEAQMDDNS